MNTKEFAEARGIPLKEAYEITGNTRWNQEVIDVVEEVVEAVEEVVEDALDFAEDNRELLEVALSLQTGIGYKTKEYLQFVLDNREELKAEYEKVKGLIERYIGE